MAEGEDFRSDPMESREGQGLALRAWSAYARTVKGAVERSKTIDALAKRYSASMTCDLFGFWLIWQLEGGFEGLQRLGMSDATIFRKVRRFRQFVGKHPDEFQMPGVTIDHLRHYADKHSRKKARIR